MLGLRHGSDGRFFVRVQPGLSLMELRDMLQKASFDTAGWSNESLDALSQFKAAPAQFFAPDPTEASAALGGAWQHGNLATAAGSAARFPAISRRARKKGI